MATEGERRVVVSAIHINLEQRSVTLEASEQPIARVTFAPDGVIFENLGFPVMQEQQAGVVDGEPAGQLDTGALVSEQTPSGAEKERTVVLSGRLRSKPKEGRPDSRGNATSWARFAVHEEGREEAHVFSATFHRHNAQIALGLSSGASLTVEGYPHESGDPSGKRLDTLSVMNLLSYPGKPDPRS